MTKMQPILAFKENKQFLSYSMVISSKIIPSRCHTSIQEWVNDGFTMTSKDNRQLNFDNILSLYLETQTMKSSSLKVWSKQKRPETDMAFNMRVLTPNQKWKIFSILIIFSSTLSALMTSNQPINNILGGTSTTKKIGPIVAYYKRHYRY